MHAQLNQLTGHPSHGAFSGGSFATPNSESNSMMKMFAPGADIQPPSTPILDPFTAKLRTRFEVPDTAQTVSLGEIVMFTAITDGENFLTKDILPIVPFDWTIKTFTWSIWDFPQHPVRPTPETAPPRFLASSRVGETTTMMRYSIGQHMSSEYAKTSTGQANQGYNLEQMQISVQETLNLTIIKTLFNCQYQSRQRMENFGSYAVVDIEKTMKKEVGQFCKAQKCERGFQILYEEILDDMARVGGKATAAILTSRINSLILAKPEMLEYYRAGPAGPATVASPNRSFLPSGVSVYYTKSYPERFNLDNNPWQQTSQIGTYHKSLELDIVKDNDPEYIQNYTSKVREITIYNQETDAMHTISIDTLLTESHIFDEYGNLRTVSNPPIGNRRGGNDNNIGDGTNDFLYLDPSYIHKTLSISQSFTDDNTRASHKHALQNNSINPSDVPSTLQVFGQLEQKHFGWENIRDSGAMVLHRLASLAQMDHGKFSQRISAGLRLYKDLSKREPDPDFMTFAVKNHLVNLYRSENPALTPTDHPASVAAKTAGLVDATPNSLRKQWVDAKAGSREDVYKNLVKSCLETNEVLGIQMLKGYSSSSPHVPLPLGSNDNFPEAQGRIFRNLTGFASYHGFKALDDAFRSGNAIISDRYNVDDLRVASEFIETMEHIAANIQTVLPGCECFEEVLNGKKTGGEVMSEQFFNMVGIPLWVNLRKAESFIVDTKSQVAQPDAINETTFKGQRITDILTKDNIFADVLNARGKLFEDFVRSCIGRVYSGDTESSGNILTSLKSKIKKKLSNVTPADFTKALSDIGTVCPWYSAANNYDITTKEHVLQLIDQWIYPTVARKNVTNLVCVTVQIQDEVADVTNSIANPKKLEGLTVKVDEGINWLGFTNPFLTDICMPLMGPMRLHLYGLVIQAMILATNLDTIENILKVFLDLNSLIIPYSETLKVAGDPFIQDLKLDTTANAWNKVLRNVVLGPEIKLAGKRDFQYPPAGATGVKKLRAQFEKILDAHFTEPKFKKSLDGIKNMLKSLDKEDADYFVDIATFTGNAAIDIPSPFMSLITNGNIKTLRVPAPVTLSSKLAYEAFLVDTATNTVARELGIKVRDDADSLGAATQVMIGGRQKQFNDLFDDGNVYSEQIGFAASEIDLGVETSFVRTPMFLSADQLHALFSKNKPELCKLYFDVRVGQIHDPSNYVNIDGQPDLIQKVEELNRSFSSSLSQFSNKLSNLVSRAQNVDWVEVPYIKVDKRSRITFFGPSYGESGDDGYPLSTSSHGQGRRAKGYKPSSARRGGGSGGHAASVSDHKIGNIAGLRVKSHFTQSFLSNCQALDENCLNELEKAMAISWMCTPFTRNACLSLVRYNVRVPINFMIVRPHANYLMETCAILAPGTENLGFTAIAGRDYTYGFTTLTKEMYANLSFWAGCIVLHPQNCRIVRNLMCVGYGPGGGTDFFNPKTYDCMKVGGSKTPVNGSESLMCLALPFTENITREYVSTSGRLQHVDDGHGSSSSVIKTQNDNVAHYSTYNRYNQIWRWRDQQDSYLMDMLGNGQFPLFNKICWSGFTLYYDPKTKTTAYATLNKGHWGENEGPTCQRVRNGAVEVFPVFDYHKKYIIVP